MKPRSLLRVSVSATPESEEAVTELLLRLLGAQPSSYKDIESGEVTVSAYLDKTAGWNSKARADLRDGLQAIQNAGLDIGAGEIRASRLPPRDWAEAWKRHFRPLLIGRKLLVLPGWIKRKPSPGQKVVVLDPGLSFGTGHHPTTSFCLKELVRAVRKNDGGAGSFLDLGSGSGILAIAAAKLGFPRICAVENDAEAVRVARENARKNGVYDRIQFRCTDLRDLTTKSCHSMVCANLVSDLLIQERHRIVRTIASGGTLVLAGILTEEFAQVARAYEDANAICECREIRREWCSGRFRIIF